MSCRLGKGSIFQFDIQVGLGTVPETQTPQFQLKVIGLAPAQPEYRILVVEDRLENRLLLVHLLTTIGFSVREVENGQEAIALWSSWQPDLIWMDIRMPVMDGYEATRQIKARDEENRQSKTIIIALTAHAFAEDRRLALAAGCDDFVCKPFREVEIFEKMEQYLGVRYQYEASSPLLNAQGRTIRGELSENSDSLHSSLSISSLKTALAQMPTEWLGKLHAAALSAREKEIWKLIAQIPSEQAVLAEALVKKVQDFRLDQIIDLTRDD